MWPKGVLLCSRLGLGRMQAACMFRPSTPQREGCRACRVPEADADFGKHRPAILSTDSMQYQGTLRLAGEHSTCHCSVL